MEINHKKNVMYTRDGEFVYFIEDEDDSSIYPYQCIFLMYFRTEQKYSNRTDYYTKNGNYNLGIISSLDIISRRNF